MRVAYLSPCWPHDRIANGIATYVASVRGGLAHRGVEGCVLTSEMSEDETDPDIVRVPEELAGASFGTRVVNRVAASLSRNLGIQHGWGVRVGRTLASLDAERPIDLCELEETFGIASVVRRHFRKPIVVRLHGPYCVIGPMLGHRQDKEFRVRCAMEYRAIRSARVVSSPATDALDRVRAFYGLELPNARVIPNPAPDVDEAQAWSEADRRPDSLLFVGRFDRVKGADILLEGFKRLAARHPNVRLDFVGPDAGLRQGARNLSLEEFLRKNVPADVQRRIVFHGAQTSEQVAAHRRTAAVTVVSSRYETFPMTVLEAMASGCPIVAPRTGGVNEMIVHEANGLTFEAENPQALATEVERLLADPAWAAGLGAAARADARSRFSVEAVADQTEDFYREVVGRG